MITKLKYLFLFIVVVIISGCEGEDLFIVPSTEKLLNVQCIFKKDKNFEVVVTQPVGLGQSGKPFYPDDCTVEILIPGVGSDELKWVKGNNEQGTYVSNSFPIVGLKYFIIVSKNGYPNLTAENFIPPASFIASDSVELNLHSENSSNKTFSFGSALNYSPPLTDENYHFILFGEAKVEVINPIDSSISYRNVALQFTNIIDEEKNSIVSFDKSFMISGNNNNEAFRPLFIEGTIITTPENERIIQINWTLQTVSKDYYLYINSINTQLLSGNNPLETPSPLYTNFKNGFGIFAGYSEMKITQIIK